MKKREDYDRELELVDITDAEELVIKIIMAEGALKMQEKIMQMLDTDSGCGDWATQLISEIDIEEVVSSETLRGE
jgi:hypothetical protein